MMESPTTFAGWLGLILVMLTIVSIVGGVMMRIAQLYLEVAIPKTVQLSMEPIQVQLVTQDGELSRVLDRTRAIETKLDNGLLARTSRMETKMDRLLEHLAWNGNERRLG